MKTSSVTPRSSGASRQAHPAQVRSSWVLAALGASVALGCHHTAPASSTERSATFLQDSTCAFDTTSRFDDPVSLARDFLIRDKGGDFLKSDAWFDSATTCPGHEPGPDAFTVIDGWVVKFDTLGRDTVRARVTYRRLGSLSGGTHFTTDTGDELRVLRVVRTGFGWRIASPALDAHVDVDELRDFNWIPDSLRLRIVRLVGRRGA